MLLALTVRLAPVPLVIDLPGQVVKPLGFTWVWDDRKSGVDRDFTLWQPLAPKGYTCLGGLGVANHSFQPPSTDSVRCVHSSYALKADGHRWIWNDDDSGAIWDVEFRVPTGGLGASAIVGQRSWSVGSEHWRRHFSVLNPGRIQRVTE